MSANDAATLQSALTALEDLAGRVSEVADRHRDRPEGEVAVGLYEVERSLRSATRRLDQVVRLLE
jgi:hypothetical protein